MDTSLFLAKVIGLVFLIFAISICIAKSQYQTVLKDLITHPALILLTGTFNLIIGVLIVVSHNIWELDWRILITLIGWLLLLRGIIWTTFPKIILTNVTRLSETQIFRILYISAVVIFIIGIVLCYFGFKI